MHFYLRLLQILGDFSIFIFLFLALLITIPILCYIIQKLPIPETIKKLVISLLVTVLFIYSIFCISEAYYRYIYDQSDALGVLKTNEHWMQKHIVYNNFQLRDDHNYSVAKTPGVTRIGVIGDSLAFAYGVTNVEDRYSDILEKKLQKAGKKVEIYNLGIPGIDTCGEIEQYKRYSFFNFDMTIWGFYLNDIQPCNDASTGKQLLLQARQIHSPTIKWLTDRSYLLNFLYWKLSASHQKTFAALKNADLSQYHNPPVVNLEKQSIASLSALLQNGPNGKRPVVVIILPYLYAIGPNYPAKNQHRLIHDWIAQTGLTTIVDLLPDLINYKPSQVEAYPTDPHPNKMVHEIAAEKLYKVILPLIK